MKYVIFFGFSLLVISCKSNKVNSKPKEPNAVVHHDSVSNNDNIFINPDVYNPDKKKITYSFDTLKLSVNDTFTVALETNFSSGYVWSLVKADSSILLIREIEIKRKVKDVLKDFQKIDMKVTKIGNFNLEWINKRPFDKNHIFIKKHSVNIISNK